MKIITLRYLRLCASRDDPFDRLVLESILFTVFMSSIGLWSDHSNVLSTFDLTFWVRAEQLLHQTPHIDASSPVIDVPVALLKLYLLVRKLRYEWSATNMSTVRELKYSIARWKSSISRPDDREDSTYDEHTSSRSHITQDCSLLYIITASVLVEQMLVGDITEPAPSAYDPACWQLQQGVAILRKYRRDTRWPRYFTSSMPIYTLGFFMTQFEDINLVREDLRRRWEFTNLGYLLRLRGDLESTWEKRGLLT
jgi:hypothetical protein